MTIFRKADRHGVATEVTKSVRVRSERGLSWAGAPCAGFLVLGEEPIDGVWRKPSIPWDDSWEPGSIVDVLIVVTLVKSAPRSRKKCHNPWPAHVHDDEIARRAKRIAREQRRNRR